MLVVPWPLALTWRAIGARGLERDSVKLAEFEQFCASMRLGAEPAAPHVTVDNRLSAAASLDDQVAAFIKQSQPIG